MLVTIKRKRFKMQVWPFCLLAICIPETYFYNTPSYANGKKHWPPTVSPLCWLSISIKTHTKYKTVCVGGAGQKFLPD